MVAAQSGVNCRLEELCIPLDPNVVTSLFDTITAAAGSYGCEVWSNLGEWHLKARLCKLQSYQATVYKHNLGVPRSAASLLTFLEVGRIQWLGLCVR
jgi:hypothetical protein